MLSLPETASARIISCDVFDTLLYRDHRSERRRFNDIALLAARYLDDERGVRRHPNAIYHARLEVQRQAYRALDLANPTGDVRFADMLDGMTRLLSLDGPAADLLYRAEIAVETAQLSANTELMAWLRTQARAGSRIIAVSDTYHTGETIKGLLAAHLNSDVIARIYASADFDATKRTGALFAAVLREEGSAPGDILHLGDDTRADVTMARAAGLRAVQLLRPRHLILRRRVDAVRARVMQVMRTRADQKRHRRAI